MAAGLADLVDRARAAAQSRLAGRAAAGEPSRAERVHALAQLLADAAAGVAGRADPAPPGPRAVPRRSDFAVGDQAAVTGADLIDAASGVDPAAPVWAADGARVPLADVLAAAGAAVADVRAVF